MPQEPTRRRSDGCQETAGSDRATIIQASLKRVALLSALDPTRAAGGEPSTPTSFQRRTEESQKISVQNSADIRGRVPAGTEEIGDVLKVGDRVHVERGLRVPKASRA